MMNLNIRHFRTTTCYSLMVLAGIWFLICLAIMAPGCGKKTPPEPLMKVRERERKEQEKKAKPQAEPANSTLESSK